MKEDYRLLTTNRSENTRSARYNIQISDSSSLKKTKSNYIYNENSNSNNKHALSLQEDTMENSAAILINNKNKSILISQVQTKNRKIFNNNYSNPFLNKKLPCTKHSIFDQTKNLISDPDIHELSYKIYPQKSLNQMSKDQLKERLLKNMKEKHFQRIKQKVEKQNEEFEKYSFQPNPQRQKEHDSEIFNKLFKQAYQKEEQNRANQLNKISKQKQDIKQQQAFLQKKALERRLLNQQSRNLEPLYKRIYEVLEQKRKLKENLMKNTQKDYIPEINKESQKICKQNESFNKKKVVQRLLQDYQKLKQKKQTLKQKIQRQIMQDVTFHPQINNFIFTDKQQKMQQTKNKLVEMQSQQLKTNNQKLFKPKINQLSLLIISHIRKRQNLQEQNNRLCYKPYQEKQNNLDQICKEMYQQCKFQPKINKISKKLCFKSSNSQKKYPKHICNQEQFEYEQVPTFYPQINVQSKEMTPIRKSQSLDKIKAKNRLKIMNYQKNAEYQNLKECSFHPKTNDWKKWKELTKKQKLMNVNGVQNYIKNCQKAVKIKQSQKQIEQKLFHLEKRYDKRIILQQKRKRPPFLIQF